MHGATLFYFVTYIRRFEYITSRGPDSFRVVCEACRPLFQSRHKRRKPHRHVAPCGNLSKYAVATRQEHTVRMPLVPRALGAGRSLVMAVIACQDALELQLPDSSP